ncbi:MAG: LptA/OstA family protein [Desulfobacterales bacterium]
MSNSHFNQHYFKALRYWAVLFLLISCFLMHMAYANDTPRNPKKKSPGGNGAIHITSDKLISDNKAGYAEFIGNVKATQDDTVITSDRLKIYYKKNIANKEPLSVSEESIHKIVAKGNVEIKFDNRVATAQQAIYNTETMVLVLSGNNSKIISENESISGEKITFYRIDGRINVESGNKKRVEAVFYSGQKGIK